MGSEFQFCKVKKSSGEPLHENMHIVNTNVLYAPVWLG